VAKSKSLPEFATRISTYAELARQAQAFAQGHFALLIVLGNPGVGKTRCFRGALDDDLGDNVCWIDGNASPYGMYCAAYEYRNQPLVLDDVDGLYSDRNAVRLLKCLCQSDPLKTVSWRTQTTARGGGIPSTFSTTSRVLILANEWKSLNANVSALEDRAHIIIFEPAAAEVHRYACTWFLDQEILDFIGARLHLIQRPSLRMYSQAQESKAAGLDWKDEFFGRALAGTALVVALLRDDASFATEEDRVRAFVASGAGCRATYFNYAQKLRPSGVAVVPCPNSPRSSHAALPAENFTFYCGSDLHGGNFPQP
jgi:hypothetical protein